MVIILVNSLNKPMINCYKLRLCMYVNFQLQRGKNIIALLKDTH